jgi:hypothetical protein
MCICTLDQKGKTVLRRNYKASPEAFLRGLKPYEKISVGLAGATTLSYSGGIGGGLWQISQGIPSCHTGERNTGVSP